MADSGSTPPSPPRRRWPFWLVAALVFAGAHLAWLLAGFNRTPGRIVYGILAIGALDLCAAGGFWWVARRPGWPINLRRALRAFAVGYGFITAGAVCLALEVAVFAPSEKPFNYADALFLAVYPTFVVGLRLLPRADRTSIGSVRMLLDGAVFLVGIGVPLWLFAVKPGLETARGLDAVLMVVWPLAAFIGVLAVNAALLTRVPLPSRGALALMLGSFTVSWLADLVFTLDAAVLVVRTSSVNWINVVNTVAVGLSLLAIGRIANDPMPRTGTVLRAAAASPIPLITIMVVAGWMFVVATTMPDSIAFDQVLLSMVVLFAILVARETLVMNDGLRVAKAEAERDARERFEALVRHSSDVILICDETGGVSFASPATIAVLGIPSDELQGQSLSDLVHPDERSSGQAVLGQIRDDAAHIARVRLRHKDGSFRSFEVVGTNLSRVASVGGFVLNLRDVTELNELEMQLQHARKMEAVGRMAGGVAHDFNNLLAAVMGHADLARASLPPEDAARDDLDAIIAAGRRGALLTERLTLLNRSSLDALTKVVPAELLRSLGPELERVAGERLSLSVAIAPEAVRAVCVPERALRQLFFELTANARDATEAHGILRISIGRRVVTEIQPSRFLPAAPGQYTVIEASDQGAGMDESTLSRLFEPFFTTKARGKGVGLSLAAIFGTVKAAGGGIFVVSEPRKGATFSIWLPDVEIATEESPKMVPADTQALEGPRCVLLIEDEAPVRTLVERVLRMDGFEVITACDADDAEARLARHAGPVHLLLTDVMMPGRSGPEFAASLLTRSPRTRVLFMSGYTGRELEANGFGQIDDRLIVKPFTIEELTRRLRLVFPERRGSP